MLLKLADFVGSNSDFYDIIVNNFDKLSSKTKETLLLKLADNDEAAGNVAYAIINNINNLPLNVQQVLLKLADNVLFKLADNDEAGLDVAYAIAENFDKLPSNIQQFLFKLGDRDSLSSSVLDILKDYSNRLPENIRKEMMGKLKEKRHQ